MSKQTGEFLAHADHVGVIGNAQIASINNRITNVLNELNGCDSISKQYFMSQDKQVFEAHLVAIQEQIDRCFAAPKLSSGQGGTRTYKLRFPDEMKDFANDDVRDIYNYLDTARDNLIRKDSATNYSGIIEPEYLDFINVLELVKTLVKGARVDSNPIHFKRATPIGDNPGRQRETVYSEESVNPRAPIGERDGGLD